MKNAKLYAVVGLLTLGNVAVRVADAQRGPTPHVVSHIESGTQVESVELNRLLAAGEAAGGCHAVVAFNPDCPFCGAAAERERLADREDPWDATLWITDQERPRLAEFVEMLSPGSRHAVAPEAFQALDVEAVPALFLVDESARVRWVGAYQGDESGEVLTRRCEGVPAPRS